MQRQTPSRALLVNPVIHPRHGSIRNSVADATLAVAASYCRFSLRTGLTYCNDCMPASGSERIYILRSWNLAPNQRALPFGLAGSGRARVQKGFEVHEYHPVETCFQEV